MCHYREYIVVFETATALTCQTLQDKTYHRLRHIYIDLGFYSTTTPMGPFNMAEYW